MTALSTRMLTTLFAQAQNACQEGMTSLEAFGIQPFWAKAWMGAPPYEPYLPAFPPCDTPVAMMSATPRTPHSAHHTITLARTLPGIKQRIHEGCLPLFEALAQTIPALQGPAGQCSYKTDRHGQITLCINHHPVLGFVHTNATTNIDHVLQFAEATNGCAPATRLYEDDHGTFISAAHERDARTLVLAARNPKLPTRKTPPTFTPLAHIEVARP